MLVVVNERPSNSLLEIIVGTFRVIIFRALLLNIFGVFLDFYVPK